MSTILDTQIGDAGIVSDEQLVGPLGGRKWSMKKLSDGRIVFIGPDTHGNVPNWIVNLVPNSQQLKRAGGTTYVWSGWITSFI